MVRSVGVSAPPSVPALALSRLAPPPPLVLHHGGVLRAPCLVSPPRAMETPLPPVSYEDATTEKNENGRTTRVEPQHGFTTQKQGSKETTGGKKNLMFEKLELESWKGGHHHQYTSTPTGNGRMRGRMVDRESRGENEMEISNGSQRRCLFSKNFFLIFNYRIEKRGLNGCVSAWPRPTAPVGSASRGTARRARAATHRTDGDRERESIIVECEAA